jgi:predicted DNA-binding ribbon-helix-helix protein
MVTVDRVQTGVRMERRLVKVLKGLAEYHDLSLGDLLEGIVLHAFERSCPFDEASVAIIDQLKRVYGLDLTARDSHRLISSDEEHHRVDMHTRPLDRDR